MNRNWIKCDLDNNLYSYYDRVWNYIQSQPKYLSINKPKLYLDKFESTRRVGSCYLNKNNPIVVLNKSLDRVTNERTILNVIIHELAHWVAYVKFGSTGHDRYWKRVGRDIGEYFGEVITTHCSVNNEALKEARKAHNLSEIHKSEFKYKVTCQDCGRIFKYKKHMRWFDKIKNGVSSSAYCPCGSHKLKVSNF